MNTTDTIPAIASLIGQLGVAGIFLWLLLQERSDKKKAIEEKDCRLNEMTDKLIQAYQGNTEAMVNLKSSTDKTNDLVDRLITDVDSILRDK